MTPVVPRVLVVHPFFEEGGGAEVVARAVMDWLVMVKRVDVTLLTYPVGPGSPGRGLLSHLVASPLFHWKQMAVSPFLHRVLGLHQARVAWLHRQARRMAKDFDVCVSTYNEEDFGRTGFQYIHHPVFLSRRELKKHHLLDRPNLLEALPPLEWAYRFWIRRWGGGTRQGVCKNVTVVNSQFIREIVRDTYGIDAPVLFPFVALPTVGEMISWPARKVRYVSVGRIAPDKCLRELVDLYAALHRHRPDDHSEFVIIGRLADPDYHAALLAHAQTLGVPLSVLTDLSDGDIQRILQGARFYIGPRPYEHFGIAALEAIQAGCLPLVHDSGGQREVVSVAELRFVSAEDLVRKVNDVLDHPGRGEALLRLLRESCCRFSSEAFQAGLLNYLGPLLLRGSVPAP